MSNPPHNPISSSDSFSDDRSSDIPPARRQPADIPLHEIERASVSPPKSRKRSRALLLSLLLLLSAAGAGLWQWHRLDSDAPFWVGFKQKWAIAMAKTGLNEQPALSSPNADSSANATEALAATEEPGATGETAVSPSEREMDGAQADDQATSQANVQNSSAKETDTLLNHRRYDEAPAEELVQLNPNSLLKLQPAAQQAVEAMLTKARAEGVQLGVISAFRTVADQNHLYFQIKAERGQNAETRAKVSAPPGYSEHHTGYAIDFIDEGRPETQLSQSFETTPAYQWLAKNAAFFNFEMSFPKDESSGVSYEPWHWRYVGDQKSLELFYKEQ